VAGYHQAEIPRGEIGELSKILEEVHEAIDADDQGVSIMVLVELADIYGALELVLERRFPTFTMGDLQAMSKVTRRAFESGHRKSRD